MYEKSIGARKHSKFHHMERFVQSDYGFIPTTHEYPDPDYAAFITQYPWRENDGYLPSALHGLPSESLDEIPRPGKCGDDGGELLDSDAQDTPKGVTWDPDYQMSEAGVT